MKKIVLFILILSCAFMAYSITISEKSVSDHQKRISEILSMSNSYRYLKPSTITCQQLINNSWQTVEVDYYSYSNQNISQVLVKHIDQNNNFLPLYRYEFIWQNDRITEYKCYNNFGFDDNMEDWELYVQYNNTFNNLNHIENSEISLYMYGLNAMINYYYTNDRLTELNSRVSNWNDGFEYNKSLYHYNGEKVDTIYTYASTNDTLYTLSQRSLNFYRNDDNSTYEDFQYIVDNSILMSENLLDNLNALLTEDLTQNLVNDSWINESRTLYEYNSQNLRSRITEQVYENNQWNNENVYELFYSELDNKLLTKNETTYSNNQISTQNRYLYDYSVPISDNTLPVSQTINLRAYPNPFNNEMNICINSKNNPEITLSLYNIKGQLLAQKSVNTSKSDKISLSSLLDSKNIGSGIYFLRANDGVTKSSKKILKIK